MIKNVHGFTLVELLVAIAILAILLGVAAPSMDGIIRRNSVATQSNNVLELLQYARSEAVRRNGNVTVCAANAARNACDGSGGQNQGFLVLFENNPQPLRDIQGAGGQVLFTPNYTVTFDADGVPTGSLQINITNGVDHRRRVRLTQGGLPEVLQ